MVQTISINTPLTDDVIDALHAGDMVHINGIVISARDAAHKKMVETLEKNQALPVDLHNQIIYYVGPSPAKPKQVIGSAGPTTSGRMDAYTPLLLEQGLKGIIGKGGRSKTVIDSLIQHHAVYFIAVGGLGVLLSQKIHSYDVQAYGELGPEAVAFMNFVEFPAIVAIDCKGNNVYEMNKEKYREEYIL